MRALMVALDSPRCPHVALRRGEIILRPSKYRKRPPSIPSTFLTIKIGENEKKNARVILMTRSKIILRTQALNRSKYKICCPLDSLYFWISVSQEFNSSK